MPHIDRYKLEGREIPSVNEVTAMLPAGGLDRWRRRVGFAEADRIGGEARRAGSRLAKFMENYRLGKTVKSAGLESTCVANWAKWYAQSGVKVAAVEPHLVNTMDGYHGSPDVVFRAYDGESVLGDDKLKKRYCDWRLVMNEAAYAKCNMIDIGDGKLEPVPWKWPVKSAFMFTFDPQTGELFLGEISALLESAFQDFRLLRQVYELNKKSEKYFKERATLLPSQRKANETIAQGSATPHPRGIVSDTAEAAGESTGD